MNLETYGLLAVCLLFQYIGLGDLPVVQQGVGGARPQVTHDERGAQEQLLAAHLVARAHAHHAPLLMQNLLHIALQAQIGSLVGDVALQFGGQRAATALDDASRAVAEHVLRSANHLISADLGKLQAERKTRDALEKSYQFRVALYINMARQPLVERHRMLTGGKRSKEHEVADTGEPEKLARAEDLDGTQNTL
jgi:hypothetical protein